MTTTALNGALVERAREAMVAWRQAEYHVAHHGGWVIEMRSGRPWFTPPRWVDPGRRPRAGGRAPL